MEYEAKDFNFQIKSVSSTPQNNIATFEGYAAVYGNKDAVGDIIVPGAFKRTLDRNKSQTPLLWQHSKEDVLGIGRLEDTEHGLKLHGELNLEVPKAREAYALMKQGAIKGMSIGYNTIQHAWEGTTRLLKELRLREVSMVTFPANEYATVTNIKSLQFERHISDTTFGTLPVGSTSLWEESEAAVRVLEHCTEEQTDWDAYGKAFIWVGNIDGKKAFRGLIADVVDGELKAMPQAVYAAASDIESDDRIDPIQQRYMRRSLDAYFDALGESAPWGAKTSLFDAWLFQGLGMTTETKYGKVLSTRNSQLVAQVRDQLNALLDAADPPEPDSADSDSDDDDEAARNPAGKAAGDFESKQIERLFTLSDKFQIGVESHD